MKTKKTKLVVYNNHTLGYICPELPNQVNILHSSILKGAPFSINRTYFYIKASDTVRLANKFDFDDFRICFEGYDDSDEYESAIQSVIRSCARHELSAYNNDTTRIYTANAGIIRFNNEWQRQTVHRLLHTRIQ
jgi:hypothetical protein